MRRNIRRAGPALPMNTSLKVLILLFVLILGGGAVFLLMWDMPPPAEKVEKVLSNDELLR